MKTKSKLQSYKKYEIIILGLLVHVLMLVAVFDIYFASPLDHGMTLIQSTSRPAAKRIVLFVADGLRAEAIFKENELRAPFLINITKENGSWGVAHTRMPTESRPGHVALLAGIYEDPSAILKGWKANPVYFDSVINQSTNAWCWGSPDIINLFNQDNQAHVHFYTYDAKLQDFGNKDSSVLDKWVFDRVESFLINEVERCTTDCDKFTNNGNLFFLHLLGIDTAGHGFKPHSNEYVNNIKLVDRNVEKITKLFNEIFPDQRTAFIFTADHGMTNWGSHGSGSFHETEVPFIAWGAGINRNKTQQDIKQIDVAPFISSLIGRNIPSNSLGRIPLNYLDLDEKQLAEIQFNNMIQLLEIFNLKRLRIERNALVYVPYKKMSDFKIKKIIEVYEEHRKYGDITIFMEIYDKFIDEIIDGIEYYQNYYQNALLISISYGFIGWIVYLLSIVLQVKVSCLNLKQTSSSLILANLLPIYLCYKQSFPWSYYFHFTFPFISFTLLFNHLPKILDEFKHRLRNLKLKTALTYLLGLELLVYGFFHRAAFSVLTVLIGFWIFSMDLFKNCTNNWDRSLWLINSLILAVFPLAPVMTTGFHMKMYLFGWLTWILLSLEFFRRLKQFKNKNMNYKIFYIQFICLMLAGLFSVTLESGFIDNNSLLKNLSWILFICPIALIPFSNTLMAVRLIATFFGFAPFYLLVSSNYETLFSVVYVSILCQWLLIESKALKTDDSSDAIYHTYFQNYVSKEKMHMDMFRRAFLFMVFIFLGFFGTGNIASLNSFDPMWVRAFLTVFSPFKMMGLILMKIMIPFLFCCCIFRAINAISKENILQMFCIILIFSDLMVLQFLFLITNKGSWLDIGSSLSHFMIMEGFVTILLILYGIAHLLTNSTLSFRRLFVNK